MSLLLPDQRAAIGGTGTFELTATFSTLGCGILRSVFTVTVSCFPLARYTSQGTMKLVGYGESA